MPTLAVVWSRCSSIYVLNEGTVMKVNKLLLKKLPLLATTLNA